MSRLTFASPSLDVTSGTHAVHVEAADMHRGLETAVLPSIDLITAREWARLFPTAGESYDLHRSYEAVRQPGYVLGCLSVYAHGHLVAASPLFATTAQPDRPLQDRLRGAAESLHARGRPCNGIPVLGLGSPMTDGCSIGLARHLDEVTRAKVLSAMMAELNREAKRRRSMVVTIKGVGEEIHDLHQQARNAGFGRLASVPASLLRLTSPSLEAYLASLDGETAASLRRAQRDAASLKFEERSSAAGIEGRLMEIYRATLARSDVPEAERDDLHPGYFSELLSRLGERCKLMLCWQGEELVSFQFCITSTARLTIDKAGFDGPAEKSRSLQLVHWLKTIQHAIEHDIATIDLGSKDHAAKLKLGARLERRWLYFRFRSDLMNRLSKPFHPLFNFGRNDPGLKALAQTTA